MGLQVRPTIDDALRDTTFLYRLFDRISCQIQTAISDLPILRHHPHPVQHAWDSIPVSYFCEGLDKYSVLDFYLSRKSTEYGVRACLLELLLAITSVKISRIGDRGNIHQSSRRRLCRRCDHIILLIDFLERDSPRRLIWRQYQCR